MADEASLTTIEEPATHANASRRQIKVAFHLPLWGNPDPSNANKRADLRREISTAMNEIAQKVSRDNSFDWYWQRGGKGVYQMRHDGTTVGDPYLRYFIVFDPPWETKVSELEQILERFRCASGQESIYLEIQYAIELRLIGITTNV